MGKGPPAYGFLLEPLIGSINVLAPRSRDMLWLKPVSSSALRNERLMRSELVTGDTEVYRGTPKPLNYSRLSENQSAFAQSRQSLVKL